jgi:glycosyltransferase involved in cell wall biosynthesis
MYVHKWLKIYDKVSCFITPSECMRQSMIQGGFPEEKIKFIPSFIDITDKDPCYENKGYILFFGRISSDKGVQVLLEAIRVGKIDIPVLIAGESTDDTPGKHKEYALEHKLKNVDFVGFKKGQELEELIKGALFTVVPSIWLDNSPMSVMESMAFGKPVIGSDIGGISEQITDECGLKFSVGDASELAYKIKEMLSSPKRIIEMGRKGRERVETLYTPKKHYEALMEIFVHATAKMAGE